MSPCEKKDSSRDRAKSCSKYTIIRSTRVFKVNPGGKETVTFLSRPHGPILIVKTRPRASSGSLFMFFFVCDNVCFANFLPFTRKANEFIWNNFRCPSLLALVRYRD